MPQAPLKPCRTYGCNKRVRSGHCPEHQAAIYRDQDDVRGSACARGYDGTWTKLRTAKIAANPLCELCAKRERIEVAREVDHIIPIRHWPDGRLEWSNLQSLCKSCHSAKTLAEMKNPAQTFRRDNVRSGSS